MPFLATFRVLSPEGNPASNVTLDWWQADGDGSYYFSSFTLRGQISTDKDGIAEVLTVAPGAYRALGGLRSGHFHIQIRPAPTQSYSGLTTQVYVHEKNDGSILSTDP